jgi:hypothetical protein
VHRQEATPTSELAMLRVLRVSLWTDKTWCRAESRNQCLSGIAERSLPGLVGHLTQLSAASDAGRCD